MNNGGDPALLLTLAFLATGCGSKGSSMVCEPGETQPCICVGGALGVQSCNGDGSGWLDCVCEGADADTDTGYDVDGEPATDTAAEDTGASDPGDDGETDPPSDPATDAPGEPEAVTGGVVGDACTFSSDCSGVPVRPMCLTSISGIPMPGGYCSSDCHTDPDCGPGADCIDISIARFCLKSCTLVSDCRESEGYTCDLLPTTDLGPYCIPSPT